MSERGIEGQPTGAGAKTGAQTSVNSPAIREVQPLRGSEMRGAPKPEFDTGRRSPFDSGEKRANEILDSAKNRGIGPTLERLANGEDLAAEEVQKDNKVLSERGDIVDFNNKKPTVEKPETQPQKRPEETVRTQKAEQEMEELRRKLEELIRQNEILEQKLRDTREELRETTRTGTDTEETISKIVSLKQRRAENAGRYMEILQEKALRQAA